jgi:hypothetical protein
MHKAIQTFTGHSFETIESRGGDYAWVLDQNKARTYEYLVCCSSVGTNRGNAFLVGKISGVEFDHVGDTGKNRYAICVSEIAAVDIPDLWPGNQNPVRYTTLEELGIDPSKLSFQKVGTTQSNGLTIAEAKAGLAKTFGVSEDNIEILIKG